MIEKELANPTADVRRAAVAALAYSVADKAMPLFEKGLADPEVDAAAAAALAWVGRDLSTANAEKAFAILEPLLDDQYHSRWPQTGVPRTLPRFAAFLALGQIDGEKALPIIEKWLHRGDEHPGISVFQVEVERSYAAMALGCMRNDKALARLEAMLSDSDEALRGVAISALHWLDRENALPLLEKAAFMDPSPKVRQYAAVVFCSVGGDLSADRTAKLIPVLEEGLALTVRVSYPQYYVGGEHTLRALDKRLVDQSSQIRKEAVEYLGQVGGEAALVRLETALADPDANVRGTAAKTLGIVGVNRAREVLIAHMAKEKNANVLMAIRETLPLYFPDDLAVAQELKEAEARVQK